MTDPSMTFTTTTTGWAIRRKIDWWFHVSNDTWSHDPTEALVRPLRPLMLGPLSERVPITRTVTVEIGEAEHG